MMHQSLKVDARLMCCSGAAALGAGLACYLLYPGMMSGDSFIQLEEARTGVYYDWHPPLMAWVWSRLDCIIPGPFGMLLLQNLMFWSGLGLIVFHLDRSPGASFLLILGIGALPPILSTLGTIWKDVAMGSALVLVFGLLLHIHRRHSLGWLALAVPVLFYAIGVRHNALLAALPLGVWIGDLIRRRATPRAMHSSLLAVAVGLFIVVALQGLALVVASRLIDGKRLYPEQQVMLHDLIAISLKTHSVWVPSFFADTSISLSALSCVHTVDNAVAAFSGRYGTCPLTLRKLTRIDQVSELRRVWLSAIIRNPEHYVAHRWNVWRRQLALHEGPVCYPFQAHIDPNRMGVAVEPTPRRAQAMRLFGMTALRTPLYRGWLYVMIALVSLVAVPALPQARPIAVLGSSSLLYALGYLPFGTTCDFRMNWWPAVAAIIGLLMVLATCGPNSHHAGSANGGSTAAG
jgi:hypothetical protein